MLTKWTARRRGGTSFARSRAAVAALELPPAVFKTCPWEPRELVVTGLRQWLRCCAAALRDDQVIDLRFEPSALVTVGRIQRLRTGLGLNYAAIGLVLDLLDHIEELESASRRRRTPPWTSTS